MRHKVLTIVTVLTFMAAVFAVFHYYYWPRAQPIRELSKTMSVRFTLADALSTHYQQHGKYPRSLFELPLETIRWGDEGSSAHDVDAWFYLSDGTNFSMTWTNARGTALLLEGRRGQVKYPKD